MAAKRRVFIAINLPKNIKEELAGFQSKWPELPVSWARQENLHLTLVFLGYISDDELPKILGIAEETAKGHKPFPINLTKICYGPPKKPPKMVWVEGEKSEELVKLQKDMEKALGSAETRPYAPHLTLGRIRQMEFRRMEPEERPELNEVISLSFEANSIEVMESRLKRGGAEHTILESVLLSK